MDVAYADAASGTYDVGCIGEDQYIRHGTGSNVAYSDCHTQLVPSRSLASQAAPR